MNEKMNFTKIVYASIIYGVWVILIGYFVEEIAPYAAIIAALGAGIYVGLNTNALTWMANGFLAGLVGGIATGAISIYTKNIAGIPISVFSFFVFINSPSHNRVVFWIDWWIIGFNKTIKRSFPVFNYVSNFYLIRSSR